MSDAIFLCFGDQQECPNCGGWTGADSRYDGHGVFHPDQKREPFNIEGIHGLHFCSEECAAEYEEVFVALKRDAAEPVETPAPKREETS